MARAARTNDAVVEAFLSLIEEGDLRPGAQRIAERAGVSLRSVFHHFQDLETLFAAAAERQMRRVAAPAPLPAGGPLADRIAAFVAARSRMLEAITPVRRAAVLNEPFSPTLAARLRWARDLAREEAARVFHVELRARKPSDRRDLLAALAVAAEWSTWEALRAHQGLTVAQARRVMARAIRALLKED
ncbi:MAG: TetR family transcriptional regulator [Chloroflexota bacterium]